VVSIVFLCLAVEALASENEAVFGDEAIRRVDNCVCYKHIDSQNLKPWQLKWDNAKALRNQISHCICEAQIDIQKVANPKRYLVPGTVIK
jgi:hypothetical protein